MSFEGVDLALFAAGGAVSTEYARAAAAGGTLVIDNSSAFRMDGDVPLIVPEVNASALSHHNNLIANPNCTAVIVVLALWPLHRENKVRRVIAATYQAASGAGAGRCLISRGDNAANLVLAVQGPKREHDNDCRAVGVGNEIVMMGEGAGINLRDDQRNVAVHAKRR